MRRTGASRSSTGAERLRWAAAAIVLAAAAPLAAQSRGERIELLEERMGAVERKLENQGLLEMQRQIAGLEAELRRMRGELDALQHDLDTARRQQRDQYLDLDTRLRAAEAALSAAQASSPPAGAEAEYQAGFGLLKGGQYDEAAKALGEFVAKHPDHELASNALYWLGEAHYVQRDFAAALAAFDGVVKNYPGARKTPDALLKAGYCQYELKRYGLARATLTRLTQEFPDSPVSAEATERLARMKAEGR